MGSVPILRPSQAKASFGATARVTPFRWFGAVHYDGYGLRSTRNSTGIPGQRRLFEAREMDVRRLPTPSPTCLTGEASCGLAPGMTPRLFGGAEQCCRDLPRYLLADRSHLMRVAGSRTRSSSWISLYWLLPELKIAPRLKWFEITGA
jgi:hypothetical protein